MLQEQPLFTSQNRGFRYGDGVFETIKFFKGRILLEELHFDRLFTSLHLLKILARENFTPEAIRQNIIALCQLNNCSNLARVRLAVYRNNNSSAGFVIETHSLETEVNELNKEGWKVDLYPYARKSCDAFANIKSANYLPYVMADLYSKESGVQETILLNTENNLCDASKANIFLVIKNQVYTPALHQGCVNGVKRRFVIEELKNRGLVVHQQVIQEQHLLNADEVFLTNAIKDIRWVNSFKNTKYGNSFVMNFYKNVFTGLYQ